MFNQGNVFSLVLKMGDVSMLQGAIAPLVFILISYLQVTVSPLPAAVSILAGNYVFGPLEAFIYSYIGMFLGAMTSFSLGKLFGRPFVNWLVGSKEKVDEWLYKIKGKEGVLLFFMFVFPFFPDDLLCAIAGLLPFTFAGFALMQSVTRAICITGALCFMTGDILPWNIWGLLVLIVVAAIFITVFIICIKNNEAIDDYIASFSRRVYYGEKYFLKSKNGAQPGKRIRVDKKFVTPNSSWRIAGVYVCEEGFVMDFYSYSKRIRYIPEVDFAPVLYLDGELIPCEEIIRHLSHAKKIGHSSKDKKDIRKFVVHYKLEQFASRAFVRTFYPYPHEKTKEALAKLVLEVDHKTKAGTDKKTRLKLIKEKTGFRATMKELFSKKKTKKKSKA